MNEIPEDAYGALSGLYYKSGRHGLAYYYNGEEWIKSEKTWLSVKNSIDGCRDKLSLLNE